MSPAEGFVAAARCHALGLGPMSGRGQSHKVAAIRDRGEPRGSGFTALRSSAVGSQHCKSLQLRIWEAQLWSQQRRPFFELVELAPVEGSSRPAAAAQHPVPITLQGTVHFYETPKISG